MKNNLSLLLNIVLLAAVAYLYYLHFSAQNPAVTTSVAKDSSSVPIAFINTDTLLSNYKMFEDMQNELAEKRSKVEKQLIARGQSLQQEASSVEKRIQAGLMSNNQIREAQENLSRKEQELMAYRETVMAGLMEEEKIINNRVYDSLISFLKEYNKDKKFRYILGYTKGGGILLADEHLDITDEILKGLNEKYKQSLNKPVESSKKK
ncbi:MAG: OmpH family outer membrane protein [Cytophagales bacterium]|nr:OmpH family outer membrane protein [Bernardetiaceae bacterium]MDW8209752.1 OmpH family outer membrane protein [Cytophagales bacterium]